MCKGSTVRVERSPSLSLLLYLSLLIGRASAPEHSHLSLPPLRGETTSVLNATNAHCCWCYSAHCLPCVCVYVCVCVRVCVCVCVSVCVCVCVCVTLRAPFLPAARCICRCIYIYKCIYIRVHTHTWRIPTSIMINASSAKGAKSLR